jgi:hypothetical protein
MSTREERERIERIIKERVPPIEEQLRITAEALKLSREGLGLEGEELDVLSNANACT